MKATMLVLLFLAISAADVSGRQINPMEDQESIAAVVSRQRVDLEDVNPLYVDMTKEEEEKALEELRDKLDAYLERLQFVETDKTKIQEVVATLTAKFEELNAILTAIYDAELMGLQRTFDRTALEQIKLANEKKCEEILSTLKSGLVEANKILWINFYDTHQAAYIGDIHDMYEQKDAIVERARQFVIKSKDLVAEKQKLRELISALELNLDTLIDDIQDIVYDDLERGALEECKRAKEDLMNRIFETLQTKKTKTQEFIFTLKQNLELLIDIEDNVYAVKFSAENKVFMESGTAMLALVKKIEEFQSRLGFGRRSPLKR